MALVAPGLVLSHFRIFPQFPLFLLAFQAHDVWDPIALEKVLPGIDRFTSSPLTLRSYQVLVIKSLESGGRHYIIEGHLEFSVMVHSYMAVFYLPSNQAPGFVDSTGHRLDAPLLGHMFDDFCLVIIWFVLEKLLHLQS